jgi:membrane associated rhomboid family serine protease
MNGSRRNSILCPNCNKLISADERVCPYCGAAHPGSWWKGLGWTRSWLAPDQAIQLLISVNVGMYVISLLLDPSRLGLSANPFALFAPSDRALLLLGASGTFPIDRLGRWWTLVSANYLHGSILHILFNMIALRQIGNLIVEEYGVYRTFILYTGGGVAGFLVSYLAGIPFTLGASAAVCSLIGAALYYGKARGGVYGQAIYKQILGWVIGLFLFGFLVPGINNWAHGGGLLGGILLALLLGYREKREENLTQKSVAIAFVIGTLGILGWAVVTALWYRLAG